MACTCARRNRFVRTPSFESEQMAGRRLHRGFHDKGLLSGDGNPMNSWLVSLHLRFSFSVLSPLCCPAVSLGSLSPFLCMCSWIPWTFKCRLTLRAVQLKPLKLTCANVQLNTLDMQTCSWTPWTCKCAVGPLAHANVQLNPLDMQMCS